MHSGDPQCSGVVTVAHLTESTLYARPAAVCALVRRCRVLQMFGGAASACACSRNDEHFLTNSQGATSQTVRPDGTASVLLIRLQPDDLWSG